MNIQPRREFIQAMSVLGARSQSTAKEKGATITSNQSANPVEYMPLITSTALVLVDTYNDFLSEKGLAWPMVSLVANELDVKTNIEAAIQACREAGMLLAFAPHHRYRGKNDFQDRKYLHPTQVGQKHSKIFFDGKDGGDFYSTMAPGEHDVVASEHACSSGFAGTDLDAQLRARNITHLILVGCISNSCIEATARSAVDLGYCVTVVTDAITAFSPGDHAVAVNTNFPLIVNHTVTTSRLVKELHRLGSAEPTTQT